MNLKHQLKLLEQCGDPTTMDRMMDVFKWLILDAKDTDNMVEVITNTVNTLQLITNTARARQTRENLLAFKWLGW